MQISNRALRRSLLDSQARLHPATLPLSLLCNLLLVAALLWRAGAAGRGPPDGSAPGQHGGGDSGPPVALEQRLGDAEKLLQTLQSETAVGRA